MSGTRFAEDWVKDSVSCVIDASLDLVQEVRHVRLVPGFRPCLGSYVALTWLALDNRRGRKRVRTKMGNPRTMRTRHGDNGDELQWEESTLV
jgi:hypothetical protein